MFKYSLGVTIDIHSRRCGLAPLHLFVDDIGQMSLLYARRDSPVGLGGHLCSQCQFQPKWEVHHCSNLLHLNLCRYQQQNLVGTSNKGFEHCTRSTWQQVRRLGRPNIFSALFISPVTKRYHTLLAYQAQPNLTLINLARHLLATASWPQLHLGRFYCAGESQCRCLRP
jgi:hypothetical protein